ncbi:MAG: bile acid:sodium symporter family protein [Pseudomonadota bacterium]
MSRITALFPLWAVIACIAAYLSPDTFASLRWAIVPLLAVIMFGMGLTLTPADFLRVATRPLVVVLGMALQFIAMPLAAFVIGLALGLEPMLLAGFVLLGASPGGTASNVICYLARGDVALSVSLTTVSTLLAVLLTPSLTWLYVGEAVDVAVGAMLLSVLKIVVAPVMLGVLINTFLGRFLRPAVAVFPLISVAAIVLAIAVVVALSADRIPQIGFLILIGVVLHNLIGLLAGYGGGVLFGQDRTTCRTLSIEVGMQNSGLALALATQFFSAAAALPAAVFSVWHNLSGAALAAWWSRRPAHDTNAGDDG